MTSRLLPLIHGILIVLLVVLFPAGARSQEQDRTDTPPPAGQQTAQQSVIEAIGNRQNNYIGLGTSPDIENAYNSLAGATPDTLKTLVQWFDSNATNVYGDSKSPPVSVSNVNMGTAANPAVDVVYGNYTMNGNTNGYGTLVVTGTLTFGGDYSWNGIILVIGDGAAVIDGGGQGQINGALFLANTSAGGSSFGSPTLTYTGGGGNGVYYDHCWVDNSLNNVNWTPMVDKGELKVISLRMLDL